MKREEIINRAIDAAADIDKGDSAVTVIKLLPHFESIVRATLQEAARAVCERCETDAPAYDPECGWWYHTDLIGCDATPIHDLLAAMGKEGDHE